MAPQGLAILLGAGPTTGSGIARILASPTHGNLAVALLSRTGDAQLASTLAKTSGGGLLKAFKSDTSEKSLSSAFDEVKAWMKELPKPDGEDSLKLKLSIFSIKHSHKTPFEEETAERYTESFTTYATGAVIFSQLSLKWMLSQYPASDKTLPLQKAGTIIFTGTLGSLRTNAGYAAYGASRASVRMLAQSLAREYSAKGVHVVHAIANGGITDKHHQFHIEDDGSVRKEEGGEDSEDVLAGKKIRAESVGKLYLGMMEQECDLWVHELDMRPAAEKF